ncbi:class I SAM-dependent methyltransferase [Nocardia panacis]|uniref:Class I SAM-dependent methyltransferase n=1 Tax=Nocardia panacis TaxID=2340916 RepID=A0A3A4K4L1_9NOCA|nr:methyltransferase domain-containing protein [Nocardia panacis]RJO69194.1 class I SAM-dependent methyltransferase [Nocardia panacis]
MARYDSLGRTYSVTRQPDPRIDAAIDAAVAGMASIANIGAGTGSYEPANTVVAVDPSAVMVGQRPPGSAPAVRAAAENLPLASDCVDAALALLTVHHWTDLAEGVAELRRIARRRIVVFTWDHTVTREFWLLRDYLPAAAETDAGMAVPMSELTELLGATTVRTIPVPHDCRDGFGAAFWRRPHAYLDEAVQAGASMFGLTPPEQLREGLARLRADLDSGAWERRYADLLDATELDLGYRLVIADL